jgi:hypothetical protein
MDKRIQFLDWSEKSFGTGHLKLHILLITALNSKKPWTDAKAFISVLFSSFRMSGAAF